MFQFEKGAISSNIAKFNVIIEPTENYDVAGTLYNDTYGIAIDFQGIRQLLCNLDEFLDYVNFPQATHELRKFSNAPAVKEKRLPHGVREVSSEEMKDKPVTFVLHVQFRQNTTWQGTLTWVKEGKRKRFYSELELINMISEIIKN